MALNNKGFVRLVITVFIIYGSTHAKKIGYWFHVFFLKSLKCNIGKTLCYDYFVRLGS